MAADRAPAGRSPLLAAILSFFVPGLGQVYAGHVVRGVLVSIPQFVVIAVLVVLFLRGPLFLAGTLLQYALAVAVINLLLLLYRAYAVVDAWRLAAATRRPGYRSAGSSSVPRAVGAVGLALLLVLTVSLHGLAAYDSYKAYQFAETAFGGDCEEDPDSELPSRDCQTPPPASTATPFATPTPSAVPTNPGDTPAPTPDPASGSPTPTITPGPTVAVNPYADRYWGQNGRLDLLLLGSDAGPGRVGTRPDAIHVASVDLATGRSAIMSLPRYLQFPPLPAETAHLWPCGCFRGFETGYLNAVYTWATDHPDDFPGGQNRGFRAVEGVVETLLGIEIDGILVVDLQGFVQAVDAIGGINIYVPERVYDERYNNEDGVRELVDIRAGWQHMDGHTALMYVRSRHQDGDIERLGRQQNFLRAMRRQLNDCVVQIVPRLPELFDALGDILRTDVPLEEVATMLDVLQDSSKPRRVEFTSDNGFTRDMEDPGMRELFLGAAANAFQARPGEDVDEPEPSPPPRLGPGC